MKVKILLLPLSIVIAIAVSILWIQPGLSAALALRSQVGEARTRLQQIETVIANIDSLDKSLNENNGNESFVRTYLPEKSSDDRILDQVNFLAGESGVLLISTGVKRLSSEAALAAASVAEANADKAELEKASASRSLSQLASDGSMENSQPPVFVSSSPEARVRSMDLSVSVFGKYEQIRDFIDRIYHANHFQSFMAVAISSRTDQKQGALPSDTPAVSTSPDMLEGNMVIRFGSLPPSSVSQGTFLMAFSEPQFNFSPVQSLRERVTRELSPLSVSPSPRPNPFLR